MNYKVLRVTEVGVEPHRRGLKAGDVVRGMDLEGWSVDAVKRLLTSGFIEPAEEVVADEPIAVSEAEPVPSTADPEPTTKGNRS